MTERFTNILSDLSPEEMEAFVSTASNRPAPSRRSPGCRVLREAVVG